MDIRARAREFSNLKQLYFKFKISIEQILKFKFLINQYFQSIVQF